MKDKSSVAELAVFGGTPAYAEPLHTHRPGDFDRKSLYARIDAAIDRRWLSNGGPLVLEFEQRIAEMAGVGHAVATSSATMALECVMAVMGLTGEVVMPSLTFAATPNAARWLGLEPVFCDVDPATGCIDAERAAEALTARTSAIVGVHLWGRTCATEDLARVAAEGGVRLLYDAAHAIGCSTGGRSIGGFGSAEVFSFHATKVVSCFEGGAVVTDDAALADEVRAIHQFGKGGTSGGINGKMSEPAAAMGLTSLDAFPATIERNKEIQEVYRAELADLRGLSFFSPAPNAGGNQQYVIAEIDDAQCGISRDAVLQAVAAENIRALRPIGVPACHQIEPFRSERAASSPTPALPHSEAIAARVISLPAGSSIQAEDVRRVSEVLRRVINSGDEVAAALRDREHHPS